MAAVDNFISQLNSNLDLSFIEKLNRKYVDTYLNDNPYINVNINCKFSEPSTLKMSNAFASCPVFLSLNVQSLNSKFDALNLLISNLKNQDINIEIIALQEIWEIQYPELLKIQGFQQIIFKKRRDMRGGGVGFFIKNGINAKIIEDCSPFESKIIEALTLHLTYPNSKQILITNVYRSNGLIPNITQTEQMTRFLNNFDELLGNLERKRHESFIFTDSNIDLLKLGVNANVSSYLDCIFSHGFLQYNFKATRMQGASYSLIDHIISNTAVNSIETSVLVCDISDHFPVVFSLGLNHSKNRQKSTLSRNFSNTNLEKFRNKLSTQDWSPVLSSTETNSAYNSFWTLYTSIFNETFPLTHMKFNKNIHKEHVFMSNELLLNRNEKLKLHKLALTSPTQENIEAYKQSRNVYNTQIRLAKKQYYSKKLADNAKNPRKTWECLNEVLQKSKKSNQIDSIRSEGRVSRDPNVIANEFNSFFTRIGRQIHDSVAPVHKQPEDYINYGRDIPDLNLGNTTPEYIVKITNALAGKNSLDIFGTSTKMVKFIIKQIAKPLSHIFNLSLQNGIFPDKLKQSRVVPIFKSGDYLECDNYRPISLLSAISKILEKIVAKKLIGHLENNDLIYPNQFGFLPNRSTEQNLMQIVNFVSKALNDGEFCVGIFLDLKKAFDVCSHEILLKKLAKMGIRGNAHAWFANYLSNRTQCVDINGTMSEPKDLDISVIQGSTLGPILFLCYINDFAMATRLFSVLFADDTTCLAKGTNLKDLVSFVNIEMQKIANWFRSNKMAVNTSKTKYIIFRNQGKHIPVDDCKIVYNANEIGTFQDPNLISPIERIHNQGLEKSFKLLGVLFDEYLAFDHHINSLCSKISRSLYCIRRVKNFLPHSSMRTLYFALVHSNLSYCLNIYSCTSQTNINKILLKQKEAVRIICNENYRAHTAPLFERTKILPISKLIELAKLKFMHRYVNDQLPLSFAETWITNRQRDPTNNRRNADIFFVPPYNREIFKKFPLYTFPIAWNALDDSKYNLSYQKFVKSQKERLLAT